MPESICITGETQTQPDGRRARVHEADQMRESDARHFDRIAAIYQIGEYLSFGRLLERCRFSFIPELAAARRALVLGDGDGRFLARLMTAAPQLRAHAVDASPAMLHRLRRRVARIDGAARLTTACADIRTFALPASGPIDEYDLVATHFFLDCLTPGEAGALAARLRPRLAPGAYWVVSEFEVPAGGPLRAVLGRLTISSLYAAFRVLTGLRVRRIPPWRDSLTRAGFVRLSARRWLGGLLVCELWHLRQATAARSPRSQREVLTPIILDTPGPLPGIDPGPEPAPGIPPAPEPKPAPGPPPEPDPQPYPGPIPAPAPVTRSA